MMPFAGRKRNNSNTLILRLALSFTKGHRLSVLACILTGILKAGLGLLFIWACKQIIDVAVARETGSMLSYSILLIAILPAEIICSNIQSYLETYSENRMKNQLRMQLFSHTLNSRWKGTEQHHSGEVMNRLEEDIRVVADTWCIQFPSAVNAVIQALGAFVFLSVISPAPAWVIAGILPLALILTRPLAKRLKMLTEEIRKTDGRIQSLMQESFQKRVILLSLLRTQAVEKRLQNEQIHLSRLIRSRSLITIVCRTLMAAGFGGGYLTAFIGGALLLKSGAVTFGMVAAFLQLVGLLQRPVSDLGRRIPKLIHTLASVSRLQDLTALERESAIGQNSRHHFTRLCGIRIENLSFSYAQGAPLIFEHFTYDFSPGSMTAIMGKTGTGKSTLTRLILALLRPDQGNINFYDSQQMTYPASPETRRSILYVPQGNSLMSGTIRENLLAGNEQATEEQMYKALHDAAAEFVMELPAGLDTPCTEGGGGLSEGQAQRIAIARALMSEGKIMILDEFSSALDSATEQRLMERLQHYRKEKTILIITHKQEVADRCDQTLRLNNGIGHS